MKKTLRVERVQAAGGRGSAGRTGGLGAVSVQLRGVEPRGVTARVRGARLTLKDVRALAEPRLRLQVERRRVVGGWRKVFDSQLPVVPIPLALGDVQVPSISDLELSIPTLEIEDLDLRLPPIGGLDLGRVELRDLAIEDLRLPAAGFDLEGATVEGLTISGVELPALATGKLTLGRLWPVQPIELPALELGGFQIRRLEIDRLATGPFVTEQVTTQGPAWRVNLGVVRLVLGLEITLDLMVRAVEASGIQVSAAIDRITVGGAALTGEVKDLELQGAELTEITASNLSL